MGQRQLAAIMFTDIVNYSALAQRNESLALELLEKHWALLRPVFKKFDGREIKTIGDAFLIEFPSALQAVEAGLAIQVALTDYNGTVDNEHAILIRIGIHLGDVERRGEDVFGDGVNIASRLEPLVTPGGVCISEPVYTSVSNKIDAPFFRMGEQRLRNISQSIVVYSNHPDDRARFINSRRYPLIAGMTTATLIVILAIITFTWIKEESPVIVATTTETNTEKKVDPAVVSDRKSVAVLPFANRSDEKKDAYFVDGIHDDILTQLSKITDMKVISRTSVMQYKDTQKTMKTIGGELGVATLLEGSVQRAGDQVRITVQLIDADTDEHLWAESYDRELTAANIFAIQREIAMEIAGALRATLSPDVQARLKTVPTRNLEALEAYFLGRQHMAQRHSVALQEAVDYFQQAIALDPEFALAYIGLADSYQLQEDVGSLPRHEMFALTKPAIKKALELDSQLGPAYNSLGGLRVTEGNYPEAEALYLKSIELNPNYSTTYLWYGLLLADLGRVEEAITMYRRGIERDPLSPQLTESLGTAMVYQGRFEEALKEYQRSMEINSTFATSYTYIGNIYWLVSGSINQAVACHRKSADLDPGDRLARTYLGLLYLDLGDVSQAEQWIGSALRLAPDSLEPQAAMAMLDLFRSNEAAALQNAAKVQQINPYYPEARLLQTITLTLLRNNELKEGRPDDARAWYDQSYPELLNDVDPAIGFQNYRRAIDLAHVLQETGDIERAALLLDRSMTFIETGEITRLGFDGYGIADVQIHALRGDQKRALAALRKAIDQGWRGFWWFYLKNNPNLELLQDSDEFQAMVQEVESFMTSQRSTLSEEVTCDDIL